MHIIIDNKGQHTILSAFVFASFKSRSSSISFSFIFMMLFGNHARTNPTLTHIHTHTHAENALPNKWKCFHIATIFGKGPLHHRTISYANLMHSILCIILRSDAWFVIHFAFIPYLFDSDACINYNKSSNPLRRATLAGYDGLRACRHSRPRQASLPESSSPRSAVRILI